MNSYVISRMGKKKIFRTLLGCFILVGASCGSPQNDPVARNRLPVPEVLTNPENTAEQSSPIERLLKKHEQSIFMGHFLLWHPNVSGERMAAIASSTAASRVAKAQVLLRQQQLQDLEQQLLEVSQHTASNHVVPASRKLASDLRGNLAGWVEGTLTELQNQNQLTASQSADFLEKFNLYCEYKVWELAVAEYGKDGAYFPAIPAVSCQKIYQSSALSECGQLADTEQHRCLWERGVLTSLRFQSSSSESCRGREDLTRGDAVQKWVEDGILQQALESDLKVSEYTDELVRVKLKQAIMGGRPILTAITQHFPELAECKDAFMHEDIQLFADARLMFESDEYIQMLGLDESSQQRVLEEILQPIRALDARQPGSEDDVEDDVDPTSVSLLSVSDRLINLIPVNEQRSTAKDSELYVLNWLIKQHLIPDQGGVDSEHSAQLKALQEQKNRLQEQLASANQKMLDSLSTQLTAAMQPEAAIAFWPLNVMLLIDPDTGVITAQMPGGFGEGSVGSILTEKHYRGVKITITQLAAEPLAFVPSARTGEDQVIQFNDMADVPEDASLVLDLYLQDVGQSLPLLSGKAYLMQGESILTEGVVGMDLFNTLYGI